VDGLVSLRFSGSCTEIIAAMPIFGLHKSFIDFYLNFCLVLRVSRSIWISQIYRAVYSVN